MDIKIRIGQIDLDGYCGRDYHPERDDSGKIGTLMNATIQRFEEDPIDDLDIFRVMLDDGRVIDLVEHEVAAICGPFQEGDF